MGPHRAPGRRGGAASVLIRPPFGLNGDHARSRGGPAGAARVRAEDFPEVASWLGSLKLEESQYGELESLVSNYGEGKEDDAVTEWSNSHPEFDFKES